MLRARRFRPLPAALAFALALGGLLPAGGALAAVDDLAGALAPDARAHLLQDLGQLNDHRFDVLLTKNVPGKLEKFAHKEFDGRHLGYKDAIIVVDVPRHHVAVHVGNGFRDHGLTNARISGLIKSDFIPQAARGHLDLATEDLAKGLLAASKAPAGATAQASAPQPVAPAPEHHFPWGPLAVVAVLGAGVWWVVRQAAGGPDLKPRIGALKTQHAHIVNQALRLDDVEVLGRFREGAIAGDYKALATRSSTLLTESKQFGEQLLEAERLAKDHRQLEAETLLTQLESRAVGLGSEVAAAVTTLERLEGTEGLTGDERDMPRLIERLGRRHGELRSAYNQLRGRAPAQFQSDSLVESRLAVAERLLTTVPVDAKEAERAILEATDALDAYRRSVDGEADRQALRGSSYGWSGSSGYLPYVNLPMGYDRPFFYTSYYEPPIVVYNDMGGGWGGAGDMGDPTRSLGDNSGDASGSWGGDTGDGGGSWGGGSDSSSGGDWGGGGDSGGGGGDW